MKNIVWSRIPTFEDGSRVESGKIFINKWKRPSYTADLIFWLRIAWDFSTYRIETVFLSNQALMQSLGSSSAHGVHFCTWTCSQLDAKFWCKTWRKVQPSVETQPNVFAFSANFQLYSKAEKCVWSFFDAITNSAKHPSSTSSSIFLVQIWRFSWKSKHSLEKQFWLSQETILSFKITMHSRSCRFCCIVSGTKLFSN